MNERIKELALQARKYAQQYVNESVIPYGKTASEFKRIFESKFAELIVRECITTMTNLESDIKQQFPWKKEDVVSTSGHIQKLKEHFGVEE